MFNFGAARANTITPADLEKRLAAGDRLLVIDVRDPWEHTEGHIPGSQLRPLGQIRTWAGELDKNAEIVVYCRSSARSGVAAKYLEANGFKHVKNMTGGIIAWRGAVAR